MKRSLSLLLVVAAFSLNVSAQVYPNYPLNSRVSSLGQTFIIDDVSDILRYPAYMNDYKNSLQVTFNSPIFGVKSIGDVVSLGVVFNRGLLLRSGFYDAGNFVISHLSTPTLIDSNTYAQQIPHVLLGFDLNAVQLGFDMFFEYSRYSATRENNPANLPSNTTKANGVVYNPGVIASVKFGSEDVPIAFKVGGGLPRVGGKVEITGIPDLEVKSSQGLYLNVGSEVGFPLMEADFTAGLDYFFENYQFELSNNTKTNKQFNHLTSAYVGFEKDIFEALHAGVLYDFVFNSAVVETDPTPTTSTNNINQQISGGIENTWQNVLLLDSLKARGGLYYSITTTINHRKGDITGGGDFTQREKFQTIFNPISPRVGLGIAKGPFQLDLSLNLGNWAGLLNGPNVGIVTASLIF